MSTVDSTEPTASTVNEVLTPYVPRLVVDWLRQTPGAMHQEIEGSMVFVDISGFTALSERLGRRGKIGAELMRDTLNVVFISLLDEAYDYGAGLLKWGGDAPRGQASAASPTRRGRRAPRGGAHRRAAVGRRRPT